MKSITFFPSIKRLLRCLMCSVAFGFLIVQEGLGQGGLKFETNYPTFFPSLGTVSGLVDLSLLSPSTRKQVFQSSKLNSYSLLTPTTTIGRSFTLAPDVGVGITKISMIDEVRQGLSGIIRVPMLFYNSSNQITIKQWYVDNQVSRNLRLTSYVIDGSGKVVPSSISNDGYKTVVLSEFLSYNYKVQIIMLQTGFQKSLGKDKLSADVSNDGVSTSLFSDIKQYGYGFLDGNFNFTGQTFNSQRTDWIFDKVNWANATYLLVNSPTGFGVQTLNGDFSGVDFTNLKVNGLDVDRATGMVNFILKGDQTTGTGANLTTEESFQKKIFLQALTVPTAEWFVSLDTNPTAVATASTAFKQTDMAELFFKADVDMKKDMFTYFYNGQGDVSVMNKWLQILAASNSTMLNSLVGRGVNLVPNLVIRGTIVPQVANNDQLTGKMNIEDSFYDLQITFPTASLNTGTATLSSEEVSFLTGTNWTTFVDWLNQRKVPVATTIRDRINGGALPNYKKLKDILPTLVAAKWYKDASSSVVPNKQFAYLIDQKMTGTLAPGLNLTQSVAWNQTFWNSQANQALGTSSFSVVSGASTISGSVNITGGVDMYSVALANATMSKPIDERNSSAVRSNYVVNNGNYINGGSASANLPNLMPDNMVIQPTVNPNVPATTFASTDTLKFSFNLRNTGGANTPAAIPFYIQITNMVTNVTTTYSLSYNSVISSNSFAPISFSLNNVSPSRYRFTIVADPNNAITEVNEFDNNIAIEYVVVQDQSCTGGITMSAAINSSSLNLSSCQVTLQGGTVTLTGNGNLTALHYGVFLKDGFKYTATATSTLMAKSVFSYSNPVSNLYGRGDNNSIVQEDLTPAPQAELSANNIRLQDANVQLGTVTKSTTKEADLALEERNYAYKSEYMSVYTVTPKVEYKLPENTVPAEITALRNQGDNIATLKIIYTTAEEKANSPEFWTVAPNPATEYFDIIFNSNAPEVVSAKLFDLNGKEVMNLLTDFEVEKGVVKQRFQAEKLKAGLYIINLKTKSGIHSSKAIVKQ